MTNDKINTDGVLDKFVVATGVLLTVFTIYYAYSLWTHKTRYMNIFLGIGLFLFYINNLKTKMDNDEKVTSFSEFLVKVKLGINILFAIVILILTIYIDLNLNRLMTSAPLIGINQTDVYIGLLLIFIVIDATMRAYGKTLGGVIILSIIYGFAGPYMPGILYHSGFTVRELSKYGAMNISGVYSFILNIGSTWVAIFIMFAGLATAYGLLDSLSKLANEITKVAKTGVVQMALIASMIMGSITGSAAANAATTGSFTIPLMKEQGVRGDVAAAIESVASSGGQILPPVMGVAAFLMADIIGVSYLRIMASGLIPALIFYGSVAVAIHLTVIKNGWTITTKSKSFNHSTLFGLAKYGPALMVLIYCLVVVRMTPLGAGFYTVIALIASRFADVTFREVIDISGPSVKHIGYNKFIKETIVGLSEGGIKMAPLVSILAGLGIVLNIFQQTGLAQRLSLQLVSLSGGSFFVLVILALITSVLFGLGMPTPAAYILVAVLTAPALVEFGTRTITAHMFVFYAAVLSALSPPVAIAVAVSSRIANSDFVRSCYQAIRIGLALFLLPFAFIANESLLFWSFPQTLIQTVSVFTGFILINIAVIGFNGYSVVSNSERGVFLILAGGLIFGGQNIKMFVILATIVVSYRSKITHRILSKG